MYTHLVTRFNPNNIKMEHVNWDKLIKYIEQSTKADFQASFFENKLSPNVANLGAKKGEIAKLMRKGEYHGLAVQFLENLRPLLTDKFILRMCRLLKKEDYITPLSVLNLLELDELHYILYTWLDCATNDFTESNKKLFPKPKKNYEDFDEWIRTVRSDPISCQIKVIEIGCNQKTGGPVVPIEWTDREFDSGFEMQEEMSKLDTRFGKPPVTFAVIHSMIIQRSSSIINQITNEKFDHIFYLTLHDDVLVSELTGKIKPNYDYVQYDKFLVGFNLIDLLEPKENNSGPKEVGVLVSRLQKAVRRGRNGSKVLIETIDSLNVSPNYNLPEQNFQRVSSIKQLVWRLFITILEDCRPYSAVAEASLLDLILLVLITQKCLEYKFTPTILEIIKLTALLAQYNDTQKDWFDWRSNPVETETPIDPKSDYHTAISLALENVIMMKGDNQMLRKLYAAENKFKIFSAPKNNLFDLHNQKVYDDIVFSSIDHHSKPHILLYYQACIPISMTLKQISGYVWNKSSGFNVRGKKSNHTVDPILREIQEYLFYESKSPKKLDQNTEFVEPELINLKPTKPEARTSFLICFGKKYRHRYRDVVLNGNLKMPIRVKVQNEWIFSNEADILNAYPKQYINLSKIDPPFGFTWTKTKITTEIMNSIPILDGQPIEFFDGSSILKSNTPLVKTRINKSTYQLIIQVLSGLDLEFEKILFCRNNKKNQLLNWFPKETDLKKLDFDLVRAAYVKIFNQQSNLIMIGPVNRSGGKMQNSIHYLLEGKIWAVFNLFHYLYPQTIIPNGFLNFHLKKGTSGYVHLVLTLKRILFGKMNTIPKPIKIKIKTKLWDHQMDSLNRVLNGFSKGSHGFGDASDVGAGKTLTSIAIAAELIKRNTDIYSGILVLLPGNALISTWKDEIKKHTSGFDVRFQQNTSEILPIKSNTMIVTTMGRMRDHPINHNWLLVIIDECLSVQNKNALQTEEAWKQSLMSKYLVMMSATFFRARFDKLYYMLQMLQTGLPEQRDYLDCILLETIVSHISSVKRKWTSNINYFQLNTETRNQYEVIANSNFKLEVKFSKLTSYLLSQSVNILIIKQLKKLLVQLEKQKHRCVIYTRSNAEAESWSKELGISIYPIKGEHVIITYKDGTYGLNDLVIYDTIIMRPPQPDHLPQIKGRLDRPGQKSDNLRIEYFILKDTIEEGLILRLNMASKFVHKYIMPLAKFYDLSVNHQQYANQSKVEIEI